MVRSSDSVPSSVRELLVEADRGRGIGGQGMQPSTVGAQGVGQDEGVEAVVFIAWPSRSVRAGF